MPIDLELQARAKMLLHYPSLWFETDFLDADLLTLQLGQLDVETRPAATEHYRYYAFRRVIDERELTDGTLAMLTRLVVVDPDEPMRESVLYQLIWYRNLERPKLSVILANIPKDEAALQEVFRRLILRRRLAAGPMTEELFEDCLAHEGRGNHVLRWLMEKELSADQWERLLQTLTAEHPLRKQAMKEHQYQTLHRRLRSELLSRALFDACLATPDSRIHEALAERELPLEWWELLSMEGANVHVRRAALQKVVALQRRR